MLKLLPLFLFLTSCQALGIKDTDTIQQAEMKIIHGIEKGAEKTAITSAPDAEPPYVVSPSILKN
jgi:hypothetical protein